MRSNHAAQTAEIRSIAALLRRNNATPIVVSEVTVFHRLSFYARRDLANRLVYAADPHLSVRYLGHDTIDRGLLDLAPWFPLKVVWWHDWWNSHTKSLVYGYVGNWTWPTFALEEVGPSQLRARDTAHLLISVERTRIPPDDRMPDDPPGVPSLYNQIPSNGPPLCQTYFSASGCPVIDDPKVGIPLITYPDWILRK